MTLSTSNMRSFMRGYDYAMDVIARHTRLAQSEWGAGMVRCMVEDRSASFDESRWFREGARMAVEECEDNWRSRPLPSGIFR